MNWFESDPSFFQMLAQQSRLANESAAALVEMCQSLERAPEIVARIHALFEEQRVQANQLLSKVDLTFVTPLDKEDFHPLTRSLERFSLAVGDVAELMTDLAVTGPRPEFTQAAEQLLELARVADGSLCALGSNLARISQTLPSARPRLIELARSCRRNQARMLEAHLQGAGPELKWSVLFDSLGRARMALSEIYNELELVAVKYA